jgi:flagellar transcriptional activator FlhD
MKANKLYEEIKETNLSYMSLVQKMLRADKAGAISNLGVSEEMADLVSGLSPAQLIKMSGTNLMLCSFHFDESLLLSMISDHKVNRTELSRRPVKIPATALAAY